MEETLFIVTHSIMAICCIWIVVVGMNFKREENVLIIKNVENDLPGNVAKALDERDADMPRNEMTEARRLLLTMD